MTTVRDATRDLLRELGLTTVFGNPCTTEVAFLTDWPSDFHYVLALQESSVVAIADGYAQASRKPVLVNPHSAVGVGHAAGHIFTTFRNSTPLIILAGQQTRSLLPDEPFLGAVDAASFPKPYVKWSCEPARAEDVPAAIARAYHVATQAPQGPVFLSVPLDNWDVETDKVVAPRLRIAGFAPDPEVLAELAAALDAAERPALVAGPAIDHDGAVTEFVALAERLRADVWASPMSARCSFPEDHRLFRGFLQPERGMVASALSVYDLVVVLGAPAFTYHVYRGESATPLQPLYVISDDEQMLARAAEGVGIRATAPLAIQALNGLVKQSSRPLPAPLERLRPVQGSLISADFLYATLSELLPDNAIVVEETPSHRPALQAQLPIRATDTDVFDGGQWHTGLWVARCGGRGDGAAGAQGRRGHRRRGQHVLRPGTVHGRARECAGHVRHTGQLLVRGGAHPRRGERRGEGAWRRPRRYRLHGAGGQPRPGGPSCGAPGRPENGTVLGTRR